MHAPALQTDVSAKVAAESHAVLVAETQHRLLEQIYPHHVLAALMEQLVQQQNHTTQVGRGAGSSLQTQLSRDLEPELRGEWSGADG